MDPKVGSNGDSEPIGSGQETDQSSSLQELVDGHGLRVSGHSHSHAHAHGNILTPLSNPQIHYTPEAILDNEKRIRIVFFITAGYATVEAVGGFMSGSLALIADSGHMFSDSASLFLTLIAYRIARRPPDSQRTYGFHRVRVLAALANGATLMVLVGWIIWEAVQRFNSSVEVLAGPMLIVAFLGLMINVIGAWILHSGNKMDGNLRGAFLHVIGDLLGSVGAIAAAVGIMLTGWMVLDPLLSVFVALLVVKSAFSLVKDSVRVLLQAVPPGVDVKEAERGLAELSEIADAGHLHAWTLTDESAVATVHVSPAPGVDPLTLPPLVSKWLKDRYAIDHVTVQVDPPGHLKRE